jgi:uncharacterized protein
LSGIRRILSIDGGGLKGALPIGFLARIEQVTGERIVNHFDLIAGTSTGGIIAIGLGLGIPAAEILDLYRRDGPQIFGAVRAAPSAPWHARLLARCRDRFGRGARRARQILAPKYNQEPLRQALMRLAN